MNSINRAKASLGKGRKLVLFGICVLTILSLSVYYHNTVLVSLGEYLVTESPLERADAIAVLSGSIPDRMLEAVDIYEQGYAPLIILTKEDKPDGYDRLLDMGIKIPEEHELNNMIAVKLGVPSKSIIIIGERSNSTYTELQILYDFLKRRNLKSVIVVTSKSHTTRATKIFDLVTNGTKIKVITRPSKYDTFDPTNWWKARKDLKQTIFEYEKLAYSYIHTLVPSLMN